MLSELDKQKREGKSCIKTVMPREMESSMTLNQFPGGMTILF